MALDGSGLTLTLALPEVAPPAQLGPVTDATVYVVVALGETILVAGLAGTVCVKPSDQISVHGPVRQGRLDRR
jgi:hypothetical protein